MAKQVVTAFEPNQFGPGSRQSSDNIPAGEAREPAHCCTLALVDLLTPHAG